MTSDTTKNIKLESILLQLLAVAFVASVIFYYFFNHKAGSSVTEESVANQQNQQADVFLSTKLADDLINEKCTKDTSNVYRTECAIELLDRKAAEREWKQRKLEKAEHPQINQYDMIGNVLENEQQKIRNWREGFEKMRDAWCEAEMSFVNGSGIPSAIASCQLEFELLATDSLDRIYYDTIMKNIYDSDGIADFEPTKADIDALVKTNTTFRGCVWAGEEDCENATSPILLNTKY